MAVVPYAIMQCDGPGCGQWYGVEPLDPGRSERARARRCRASARRHSWGRVRHSKTGRWIDLCAHCMILRRIARRRGHRRWP